MTDDRSLERAARSWIEAGPTQAPDRAIAAALLRIETTPQERDLRIPWRLPTMTTPARVAAAAVIGVLAVGGAFFVLRPADVVGRRARSDADARPVRRLRPPTPTPSPSPDARSVRPRFHDGPLAAGTYVATPFDRRMGTTSATCRPSRDAANSTDDDTIRIHAHRPRWLVRSSGDGIWRPRHGTSRARRCGLALRSRRLAVERSVSMQSRPRTGSRSGRPSPTSSTRSRRIPLLDTTTPADVTLAGYAGKYFDLQVPADISTDEKCNPSAPTTGPGNPGSTPRARASAGTSGSSTSMAFASWSRAPTTREPSPRVAPSSRRSWTRSRSNPDRSIPAAPATRLASSDRGGQSSMFYVARGSVPPKRHTQHRAPDGCALRRGAVRGRGVHRAQLAPLPPRAADPDAPDRAGPRGRARGGRRRLPPPSADRPAGVAAARATRSPAGSRCSSTATSSWASSARPTAMPETRFYRNGEADEMLFVHEGTGVLRHDLRAARATARATTSSSRSARPGGSIPDAGSAQRML